MVMGRGAAIQYVYEQCPVPMYEYGPPFYGRGSALKCCAAVSRGLSVPLRVKWMDATGRRFRTVYNHHLDNAMKIDESPLLLPASMYSLSPRPTLTKPRCDSLSCQSN